MKHIRIDYGCGVATLYTPHEAEGRFYALARTCFGIRKSIMGFEILDTEDVSCDDYERLEFSGDVYGWREDGARKMLEPWPDDEWDTDYCEECRYHDRGERGGGMNRQDEECCLKVAELWKEMGGDAEGLLYCWHRIVEMLRDMEVEE